MYDEKSCLNKKKKEWKVSKLEDVSSQKDIPIQNKTCVIFFKTTATKPQNIYGKDSKLTQPDSYCKSS